MVKACFLFFIQRAHNSALPVATEIHNSVVTVTAVTTTLTMLLLLVVLVTVVMVVVVNGILVASSSVFVRSVGCNCVVCVGLTM